MTTLTRLTRREAIKRSAALIGSMVAIPLVRPSHSLASTNPVGASERVHVGIVGVGARGKTLVGNLPHSVRVAAVCDCATSRMADTLEPKGPLAPLLSQFREMDADRCATYQDYRRMLDREKKLDAVIVATPDHHHALAATLALEAGLDVYLEKPLTVSVAEGRHLADLVKRTGRVLQVGSQQRTMEINRFACEFIRDGGLGKVTHVELPNYPGPLLAPSFPAEPIPEGLDWNLFCGPTELRPHNRKLWVKDEFKVGELLWRGWDLWRDYSGHMMTNWGAHTVDMVQYALGRDSTGPVAIRTVRPKSVQPVWEMWKHKTPAPFDSDQRRFWPVVMRYVDGIEIRFVDGPDDIVFHGERGRLRMRRNHFETDPADLVTNPPDPKLADKWRSRGNLARLHLENWLDCIRTGGTPNAPVEAGHRTVSICHLANIARELNRPLKWNPTAEQFVNDDKANTLLERPRRQGFRLR